MELDGHALTPESDCSDLPGPLIGKRVIRHPSRIVTRSGVSIHC